MKRNSIAERPNWQAKVEALGFHFHTLNGIPYWDETASYEIDYREVKVLEDATRELYALCIRAVDHVIKHNLFDLFQIPSEFQDLIRNSWNLNAPSLYGRFDLSWDGNKSTSPKMLEFNADTPTSLLEGSVVQWFWLQDRDPGGDQFNSIHEKLIEGWKKIGAGAKGETIWFSCLRDFPEDFLNLSYIQDCATQAGMTTGFIDIADIGLADGCFVDLDGKPIRHLFKLYPWEWLINEEFGSALITSDTNWIEPPWKMLLSNKAILPVLWKLFPGHPNLLEAHFDHQRVMDSYAIKPLLSREGANVTLVENNSIVQETRGEYGEEGFVFQKLQKLPCFEGHFPVIGSWVIDGQPAGIGIRETDSLVTDNFSRFIPHLIRR